jgi:glycerol kinase
VRLRLEGAVAAAASVSWLTRELGTLYGQLAPTLELHSDLLHLGVRAQAVVVAPQSDFVQLSAGAYVGLEQPHWSLDLHGACNIDPPLGFIGRGLSVCGAWLSTTVSP